MLHSVKDYMADPDISPAERSLIAACQAGRDCTLGELPPEGEPDDAVRIRADLIRMLALGGTPECELHCGGVNLAGGHITGWLDLRFARTLGQLVLSNCRFDEQPQMSGARLDVFSLDGSALQKGLIARGVKVAGGFFLRRIMAKGEIDLARAEIGGSLELTHAIIQCKGTALKAQGIEVKGAVFLQKLTAQGEVNLMGAEVIQLLDCQSANFQNADGVALNAQGMRIQGGFIFRGVAGVMGTIVLNSAQARDLVDDAESWALCDELVLEGFTYVRMPGDNSPRTFNGRREWLEKGSLFDGEFSP
jgi:hypothetical protein